MKDGRKMNEGRKEGWKEDEERKVVEGRMENGGRKNYKRQEGR